MPSFVLPGHKYLGPGNKLESGNPTNSSDRIARVHDYNYAKAKDKQHIFKADQRAIHSFAKDFIKNPSIGSFLGFTGLGIKHGVESTLNSTIYPTFSGNEEILY